MRDLLIHLRTLTDFSEESWNVLQSFTTICHFKKGAYMVTQDKDCQSLFFISKGYCRAFHIQEGIEINTNFYFENEIATNINSYVRNHKASFTIQACEPVIAYRFDKDDILKAGITAPEIEKAGKLNLQLIAAKQENQIALYRLLTARQRYEYLESQEPQILQRVPLTLLSSYLGVTRETLSRIRNRKVKS